MKNYSAKEIKNIVLIGAPGTGKRHGKNYPCRSDGL